MDLTWFFLNLKDGTRYQRYPDRALMSSSDGGEGPDDARAAASTTKRVECKLPLLSKHQAEDGVPTPPFFVSALVHVCAYLGVV